MWLIPTTGFLFLGYVVAGLVFFSVGLHGPRCSPSSSPSASPWRWPGGACARWAVIRALLGLFGAFELYGTAYFAFFASRAQGGDPQGLVEWLVVAWSTALALAFLVAAARLGSDRRVVPALAGVLVVDLVFSLVKLTAYDEPEALGFMAVDLVVVALLALAVRRKRDCARSSRPRGPVGVAVARTDDKRRTTA